MRFIHLLIAILLIFGCKSNIEKKGYSVIIDSPIWNNIYMELDGNQELILYNNGDSAVFTKWTDSLVKSKTGRKWVPINQRQERFHIEKDEKDSLYKWIDNLVKNPVNPKERCTCYVGHLIVRINYGHEFERISQTCEYSSVCDWNIVSKDTESIYKLLKTKLKEIE